MVCENVFTPMYGVLATFPNDLTLFTREHKSGLYSAGIFYLSKLIALVSYQIFLTLYYIQGINLFLCKKYFYLVNFI